MNAWAFLRGALLLLSVLLSLAAGTAHAQSADPAPQLRAAASFTGQEPLTVGATATLQVDVLTSTWFTQPPELSSLNIPGAMVTGPTGDATLIRDNVGGVAYSGLRFSYQVSPTAAGALRVPPLTVRAQVGQASAPLSTSTQALTVQAATPPGMEASGHGLAASSVQVSQQVQFSAQPPAVGDHIRRTITVQAQGAQAMLIPPPDSAPVPGLKAYSSEPELSPLSDSRGGFLGGQRVDRIDYVVERAGAFALPEVEVRWWNVTTKREERAVLPAQPFDAHAGAAYQAPFSVQQDLRDLGRQVQVRIPGGWLALAAAAAAAGLAWWLGMPWCRRAGRWLRATIQATRRRWQASEACAAVAARRELARPAGRLDALYRWLRVSRHRTTVSGATADLPAELRAAGADALRDCYGRAPDAARGLQTLRRALPAWRRGFRAAGRRADPYRLVPLNPRMPDHNPGDPS